MLWWSVEAFKNFDEDCRVVLAVHPDYLANWDALFGEEEKALKYDLVKVAGGSSRIESVRNGLRKIKDISDKDASSKEEIKVFIHDAARPLVTPELIGRGEEKIEKGVGAVPVIPVTDSLRQVGPDGTWPVDRQNYVAVQTPQIFLLDDILAAYEAVSEEKGLTDDASVAEKFGLRVEVFEGDPENIKVTNPSDFKRF